MIRRTLLLLALLTFAASATNADVIVNKTFRETPFSDSLGVDGIYKIEVRDANGKVHRRLVTAEVYNRYAIGEDFSDRLLPVTGPIGGMQIATHDAAKPAATAPAVTIAGRTVPKATFVHAAQQQPARKAQPSAKDLQLAKDELKLVRATRVAKHVDAPATDIDVAQQELKLVRAASRKATAKAAKRKPLHATMALITPLQDMQPDVEGF
jgi:hypothetical protein